MHMKIKSKRKFLSYTILYTSVLYYKKIKSKRKFKIRNIKLSKISLPTVCVKGYEFGCTFVVVVVVCVCVCVCCVCVCVCVCVKPE